MEGIARKLAVSNNERLVKLKTELWNEYTDILDQEAYWYQQSRSKWLRLGDRNTKYFHQSTLAKR